MPIWKIYCCAPHLTRVVQSIRDLSGVTGICKSFQVQKMTIQSTISLLFSSLSSFHLPGFFSSQLLIFFPCISRVISLFSWCLRVILHFSPIRLLARCKSENLAKCCRRGVRQLKEKVWQKAARCTGNPYCNKGRQGGVKPHLFIDPHFWKEIAVFFYQQPKGAHISPSLGSNLGKV